MNKGCEKMSLSRLSRNKRLRLAKVLKNEAGPVNTMGDLFAIKQADALAENKKFNAARERRRLENQWLFNAPTSAVPDTNKAGANQNSQDALTSASKPRPAAPETSRPGAADAPYKAVQNIDAQWEGVLKIPMDASELMVITKAKKLGAYVLAVTQKSPAKFRGVFIARLQNFCLDIVADLLGANFIRMDCADNKKRRETLQTDAIVKLKMLGYVALLAQNAGCILMRQYKQISLQIGETVNLATAWKKSDDEKWKEKQNRF